MKNYRNQIKEKRCSTCTYYVCNHDEESCSQGIKNPVEIDYELSGDLFTDSIHAYHKWADGRDVNWFGVCDLWEDFGHASSGTANSNKGE
jgi:hypothetical protein